MEKFTFWQMQISIHALREESDYIVLTETASILEFQSTLSVRRATCATHTPQCSRTNISIHALREESDKKPLGQYVHQANFNPRSP